MISTSIQLSNHTTKPGLLEVPIMENTNGTPYKQVGIISDIALIGGQGSAHYWIEGVGGNGGLFSTWGSDIAPLHSIFLDCMQANDTIWPYGESGACWPTGVLEHNASDLRIFPNPSFGLFYLPATQHEPLTVLDIHGREVLRLPAYSHEIDLTAQPPGVYTAVVQGPAGRRSQKLVVMR